MQETEERINLKTEQRKLSNVNNGEKMDWKRKKKRQGLQEPLRDYKKISDIHIIGVSIREKKKKEREKVSDNCWKLPKIWQKKLTYWPKKLRLLQTK